MKSETSSGKISIIRLIVAVMIPLLIIAIISAILFYPSIKKIHEIDAQTNNFVPQGIYRQQGDLEKLIEQKLRSGNTKEKIDAIMMANLLGREAAPIQALALSDADEEVRLSAAIQLFVHNNYSGGEVLANSCRSERRDTLQMLSGFISKYFPAEYHFTADDPLDRRKNVSEKLQLWFSSKTTHSTEKK